MFSRKDFCAANPRATLKDFCDPHKSRCIKCENGHAQCTLMKSMVIPY